MQVPGGVLPEYTDRTATQAPAKAFLVYGPGRRNCTPDARAAKTVRFAVVTKRHDPDGSSQPARSKEHTSIAQKAAAIYFEAPAD